MKKLSRDAKNAHLLLNLFGPKGEHWTQNVYARSKSGKMVDPIDKKATKWCLMGGVIKLGIDPGFLLKHNERPVDFNDKSKSYKTVKSFLSEIAEGK